MPNFANPFQGNVNRKMTNAELMQAIRLDIAGELEAIYLYESHILATDDLAAKKVLEDIRDEEKEMLEDLGITKNAEVKTGMTVGSLKE